MTFRLNFNLPGRMHHHIDTQSQPAVCSSQWSERKSQFCSFTRKLPETNEVGRSASPLRNVKDTVEMMLFIYHFQVLLNKVNFFYIDNSAFLTRFYKSKWT